MSSQAFLGPTPISEKSSSPFFKLATALPDTAAGIDGSLGSFAPSTTDAQSNSIKKSKNFFIAEILRVHGSEGKDRSAGSVTQNTFSHQVLRRTPGRNLRRLLAAHASFTPGADSLDGRQRDRPIILASASTRIGPRMIGPRMIIEPKT